jgi:hypothetical protein
MQNDNITALGPEQHHGGTARLIVKQFGIRDVAANHAAKGEKFLTAREFRFFDYFRNASRAIKRELFRCLNRS